MSVLVALDIGGTKLAGGVFDWDPGAGEGRLIERREGPARAQEGVDVSLGQCFHLLEELVAAAAAHGRPEGIGVCSPGPLDPRTGVIFNPTNMPGWVNIPLGERIEQRFGLPCRVENDANGAGLGEAVFGAGRGCSSVFYATLSTGIGTGIILDRRVYHGKNGAAGEGGHVSIDWRSPAVCNCGNTGCIEALASGTSMARRARAAVARRPESALAREPERITAETIAQAAAAGDALAAELIEETAEMLGAWLGSILSLLDPDIIILGGGLSRIGEPLLGRIRESVPRRTINPFAAQTPIVPAQLGADAGLWGAAAVILAALRA